MLKSKFFITLSILFIPVILYLGYWGIFWVQFLYFNSTQAEVDILRPLCTAIKEDRQINENLNEQKIKLLDVRMSHSPRATLYIAFDNDDIDLIFIEQRIKKLVRELKNNNEKIRLLVLFIEGDINISNRYIFLKKRLKIR